ncbi:three component ABC system middle component [Citricoccus alkalitolerans]|uniref:Three component ABC system middle component n=1 Tax=Citricoccus alkalitolerans TaxID=246603 RepID=A0ABV8XXN5_9MICC
MSQPPEPLVSPVARAPEAMALFNTVLTTELLVNACWAKAQNGTTGLAWPAAYLILPLTLHPQTRDSLPRDRRITLARWAVRNHDLLADMEFRVANMALPTKRAIRHGLRSKRLGLDGTNLVALARPKNATSKWPTELSDSVKAARFCGQWFNAVETHLAFELLGIGG